jgi:hypothetical protein
MGIAHHASCAPFASNPSVVAVYYDRANPYKCRWIIVNPYDARNPTYLGRFGDMAALWLQSSGFLGALRWIATDLASSDQTGLQANSSNGIL